MGKKGGGGGSGQAGISLPWDWLVELVGACLSYHTSGLSVHLVCLNCPALPLYVHLFRVGWRWNYNGDSAYNSPSLCACW